MNDDPDIRAQFASSRRAAEARTPSFERVLKRATTRPRRSAIGIPARVLAALLVIVASLFEFTHHRPAPMPGRYVQPLADWHAATDVLLATPGRELLRSVPDIGHYSPLPRKES